MRSSASLWRSLVQTPAWLGGAGRPRDEWSMEVLGADYRFETRFYLDADRVLYIRGGGDPFLISEELAQLASALQSVSSR
jgi:hypothetical protein